MGDPLDKLMPLSRRWAHGPRNAGFRGSHPAIRLIVRIEISH